MSRFLPSDPNFLLNYLEGLPSDDSESDFDGYIDDEDKNDDEGCCNTNVVSSNDEIGIYYYYNILFTNKIKVMDLSTLVPASPQIATLPLIAQSPAPPQIVSNTFHSMQYHISSPGICQSL